MGFGIGGGRGASGVREAPEPPWWVKVRPVLGKTITFETYVFTLSDGMTATHSVGEIKGKRINLTAADREELRKLREANRGEDLGIEVREVRGRTFSFRRERFILSDGTEVIWSKGEPTGSQ
jgi:hypothetical protein